MDNLINHAAAFQVMNELVIAARNRKHKAMNSDLTFDELHDLSICQINLGRLTGHTTFISRTMSDNDIVILANSSTMMLFDRKYYRNVKYISVSDPIYLRGHNNKGKTTFIDDFSTLSENKKDDIHNFINHQLYRDLTSFFILLG
jgi:hypothetical protein